MGNNSQHMNHSEIKPTNVTKCISIKKDPITGKLVGVPKEWANILNADQNCLVETDELPIEVRATKERSQSEIKTPNKKVYKVDRDATLGIKGLDEKLGKEICRSGISKQDILTDSDNFISILEIYDGKELPFKSNSIDTKTFEFKYENPALHYIFTQQIGKGFACKLYKIIQRNSTKEFIAKVYKFHDQFNIHQLKREIIKNIQLDSHNIVKYIDSYLYSGCIFVILEYLNQGSLSQFIQQHRKHLTEQMIAFFLYQILLGMKLYIHKGLLHGNLKSDKILINDKGEIKLLAMNYRSHQKEVDPYFMAPELIQNNEPDEFADIWSLGIIAYQLSEGNPPYYQEHPIKVLYNYLQGTLPNINANRSNLFKNFLSLCLNKSKTQRSNIKNLLNHEFIVQNRTQGEKEFKQFLQLKIGFQYIKQSLAKKNKK